VANGAIQRLCCGKAEYRHRSSAAPSAEAHGAHLEDRLLDHPIWTNAHLQLHHITARRRAHQSSAHPWVGLVQRADVAWALVVVDDALVVEARGEQLRRA